MSDKPAAGSSSAKSSMDRQREAVRRQVKAAVRQAGGPAEPGGWFSYSWTPAPITPLGPPPAATAFNAVPPALPSADCDPLAKDKVDPLLDKAAKQHGLERSLLQAVVEQESGFRPCAVSPKGAQGLMQLLPATAGELAVTDPFDPEQNVLAGARYLKQLLEKYKGNLSLALSAYNIGAARVDKDGAIPDVPETQDYVRRILSRIGKPPEVQSF